MSFSESEKSGPPKSTSPVQNDPQLRALSRKLFFISMATAALPVVIALGIISESQLERSIASASGVSLWAGQTHFLQAGPSKRSGDATETGDGSAQATAANRSGGANIETPSPSIPTPRVAYSSLGDDVGMLRLENTPPEGDALQQILLRGAAAPLVLKPFYRGDADIALAEENDASARATAGPAGPAKRVHAEIKPHALAHHRHRPPRHAPPSLFAKIGRSVKAAFINVVTLPRNAMDARLWD